MAEMNQPTAITWECRHCKATFDTKGRRDAHYRKSHQESTKTKENKRTTDGTFMCTCSASFTTIGNLKRHQESCTIDKQPSETVEGTLFELCP